MDQQKQVQVTTQLCGMKVLEPTSGEQLGVVLDIIVQPTTGKLLGITLRTRSGDPRTILAANLSFQSGVALASSNSLSNCEQLGPALKGGVYARKGIIGFSVVTEDGRLLGHVRDLYLSTETLNIIYCITESAWWGLFNGDFFINGNVPQAYSRMGMRLTVPDDTVRRWASMRLMEAA